MSTTTPHRRPTLVRPRIPRPLAMRLADDRVRPHGRHPGRLGPDDWTRPTDCPVWDVRQLACHMVGMAAHGHHAPRDARQPRKADAIAEAEGVDPLTATTGLQVSERADWTIDDIVKGATEVGPKAAPRPTSHPGFMRKRPFPTRST